MLVWGKDQGITKKDAETFSTEQTASQKREQGVSTRNGVTVTTGAVLPGCQESPWAVLSHGKCLLVGQ